MIPRRCPKCQRLVEEAESHATDPSVNPLWAVPDHNDDGMHPVPAGPNGMRRQTAADVAHGAVSTN